MARTDRTGELLSQLKVNVPTQTRARRHEEPQPIPPVEPTTTGKKNEKTKYWQPVLVWVQEHGFTHPSWGGWLQLPREFDAILAMERKPVTQIILEIMRQTIGWVSPDGYTDSQGRPARVEWARITHDHFAAICSGSPSQVRKGLEIALERKYIERQRIKGQKGGGFEYRIRWSSPKDSPTT